MIDAQGNVLKNVTISGAAEAKAAAASKKTTDKKAAGKAKAASVKTVSVTTENTGTAEPTTFENTVSPQTGDDSMTLGYLYLILLVAGAVALISRKKESRNS